MGQRWTVQLEQGFHEVEQGDEQHSLPQGGHHRGQQRLSRRLQVVHPQAEKPMNGAEQMVMVTT